MTGATLLTVTCTSWLSVSAAPSSSKAVTVTLLRAGPSGKVHLKLPVRVSGS